MSIEILVLMTGVVTFLTAMVGLVTVIYTRATHHLVNSRMTELLSLTRKSSHAEGVKEEKETPS